jgi:hypothetical protein
MLAFAGSALAQSSPTGDAYSGVLGLQQNSGTGGGGGNAPAASQSAPAASQTAPQTVSASPGNKSLPFTGFELGLVALAGVALLGSGFALRRVSTARGHAAA